LWMLDSYFRDEPDKLETALSRPKWDYYANVFRDIKRFVDEQDRATLDAELPIELCQEAMSLSTRKYIVDKGFLREFELAHFGRKPLSALEAFNLYGGECLEEVQEYGCCEVSPPV